MCIYLNNDVIFAWVLAEKVCFPCILRKWFVGRGIFIAPQRLNETYSETLLTSGDVTMSHIYIIYSC